MKATKLILAAALFTGLATFSIAGPGPQYWAQRTQEAKERQAQKEQAQTQPKSEAPAPTQTCSQCGGCAGMQKS